MTQGIPTAEGFGVPTITIGEPVMQDETTNPADEPTTDEGGAEEAAAATEEAAAQEVAPDAGDGDEAADEGGEA